MFKRTKKGPDRVFEHQDNCKILAADPTVRIEWSEIERGYWEAVCLCGKEYYHEPASARVRLDPLDPKTSRHLRQCEFAHESDPFMLRALLKITAKDGYAWVECCACGGGWQVADFAPERHDSLKSKAAR
jgi:hypothetical protein